MVTRRTFLAGNAAILATSALDSPTLAFAAKSETAVRQTIIPNAERDFWNDWPRFITQKMNQAAASRNALLGQIRSKEQMANRAAGVRSQLWQIIGGRPDATPLNARTVGRIERSGYRIEKVIFESMPLIFISQRRAKLPTPGSSSPWVTPIMARPIEIISTHTRIWPAKAMLCLPLTPSARERGGNTFGLIPGIPRLAPGSTLKLEDR
jgi:hypothetical protein